MFGQVRTLGKCLCVTVLSAWAVFGQTPVVGPNVNMVSGTQLGTGDPFLTKQNEPSIAVSSINSQHLLAGANDHRLVDLSQSLDTPGAGGDSWLGLFRSVDGGRTWRSTVVGGCPLNVDACNDPKASPIKGLQFASDPTVRSGPYGTFFYSFLAGNRGTGADGVIGVQRFIDFNDKVRYFEDPVRSDVMNVLDRGTSGQFLDKPWNAADVPGRPWNAGKTCMLPNYSTAVPAFNVYVSYSNFVGQDPANPHPQIFVVTSTDCGATFGKPKKVSQSVATNTGTVIAIDPTDGAVYVIWRQFFTASNQTPDAIYFSKSTDGGGTWSNPKAVAEINAFDQFTTGNYQFRSSGYPTAAVSVDSQGKSRLHVAWTQRGVGPAPAGRQGAARIVITTSANGGNSWSAATPVDNDFTSKTVPYTSKPGTTWAEFNPANPEGYGHQIQPALTFAGGKLTVVWLDQRLDQTYGELQCPGSAGYNISVCWEARRVSSGVSTLTATQKAAAFTDFITESTPGMAKAHTLDVFAAQALPDVQGSGNPVFVSTRVSQYPFGSVAPPSAPGTPRQRRTIRQLRFFVPNLPIYVGGTATFIGDYVDVAAVQFVRTGDPLKPYRWNTDSSVKTVFHGSWTDNRDVVRPPDGDWRTYTPIRLVGADLNSAQPNASCDSRRAGMKNQNLYSARIFEGLDAYAVLNSKYLNNTTPRQFNVVVQNGTGAARTFDLSIATPPVGTTASFKLTEADAAVTLNVPPFSSATRTLWVKSPDPGASVTVNVQSAGFAAAVVLNPDRDATILNGAATQTDIINNNQSDVVVKDNLLQNNDLTNVAAPNNDLTNNDLTNNDLTNNDLTNNDLTNIALTNNDLTNNDLTNSVFTNAVIINNDLTNNDLTNNDLTNRVPPNNDLTNNDLTNNDLTNNDLTNNDLTNAGLSDATFTIVNNGTTDQSMNLKTIMRGFSTPMKVQMIVRKTANSVISNPNQLLSGPAGTCGYAKVQQSIPVVYYSQATPTTIDENIGKFLVDDPATPTVTLMPGETASITYRVIVTGTDLTQTQPVANEFATNGVKLVGVTTSGTIVPIPLIIQTLSLPPATVGSPYQQTLLAAGGKGARTWSTTGGALPAGFSLNPSTGELGTGGAAVPAGTGGSYTFTIEVKDTADSSTNYRQQTDKQTLTLIVKSGQTLAFPVAASIQYGSTIALNPATDAGLPVTYSVSGGCSLTGLTLRATAGFDSCVVSAAQAGSLIYLPLSTSKTYLLSPAPLMVTADNKTKVYGAALPDLTASATGLVGSDTIVSLGITLATAASQSSSVGAYDITVSPITLTNYVLTPIAGSLTVTPAPLTVTADNKSMTYGGALPAFTSSYSGFVNGDTAASLGGTLAYSTTATSTSPAGPYPVTPSGLTSTNYAITFANGTLTVTPANLIVTANNTSKTYGAIVPAFTVSYSAFVAGDTAVNLSGTLAFSSPVNESSNVGSYPITPSGLTSTNYTISFVNGSIAVTPAPATVTVVVAPASKAYGDPAPLVSLAYTGLVLGQTSIPGLTVSPAITATSPGASASPYPIVAAGSSTNYALTFLPGSLTVNKATPVFSVTGAVTAPVGPLATLNGTIAYTPASGPAVYPTGNVMITVAGVTSSPVAAAINPATGAFSASIPTAGASSGAHAVTYSYTGDSNFAAAANGTATLNLLAFQPTTGSMIGTRSFHASTLLNNGKVLVIGGMDASGTALATAEVYDPVAGTFALTSNNMPNKAAGHAAVRLPDGNVLVVGGGNSSSQLYNAAANSWSPGGGGAGQRTNLTAVLLPTTGKVLIAGGSDNSGKAQNSALLYDPATGNFTATGNMTTAREFHSATVLVDGRVLIAGGRSVTGARTTVLSSAEIYNPATGTFTAVATPLGSGRFGHTATRLADGRVVIAGGSNGTAAVASADLFDPTTPAITPGPSMTAARQLAAAVLLGGNVFITGGSGSVPLNSTDLLTSASAAAGPSMISARTGHTATLLGNGSVVVIGGQDASGKSVATAEIYVNP